MNTRPKVSIPAFENLEVGVEGISWLVWGFTLLPETLKVPGTWLNTLSALLLELQETRQLS